YDRSPISRSSTSTPRSFARSLSRSISQSLRKGKSKAEFNVDDLQYDGEPITFACIAKANHREFYVEHVNDTIPDYLVKSLNNNRGLSLFFLGAGNEITSASGLLFKFAREWFITSGNNVCFVSYCYSDKPRTGCQAIGHLDKLVVTNRLEYVAKMVRDLVLNVRYQSQSSAGDNILHMSRVDVTGFSFGAHIAGRTAEYLLSKTGEKVRMLLALDPSRTPPFLAKTPKDTIKPDLAEYVQVIHTSSVQGMTKTRLGHVDIYARLNGGRIL
ncbi:phospholipase A1-like, partial [Contarinia nasturtii]|uniref:phospholipase A1-like n=1 Tax=Contarinia nasturtii TaxID=265458 RepID=UPI0012D49742